LTYKISFTETGNGKITGTSLTDIYGKDRTLTKITGTFDKRKGLISFNETENISTKSKSPQEQFCYIEVKNARIKLQQQKSVISGKLKGRLPSGKNCADGELFLMSNEYLNIIENKVVDRLKQKQPDSSAKHIQNLNELKKQLTITKLTSGDTLAVKWKSKELIIEIWDGQFEDRDEISITINKKPILDRITIKEQKKIIVTPLDRKENNIVITAVSEGLNKPCTANITLKDGTSELPNIASLKKGETIVINLIND
jgi:hypothetical protein